ncbi:peroxisomal and mitochondrial division factor 2-like [Nicotiana sylvestris]|uniref:peroxisomal and mitochondrial division factor 2-like n=1 Tax=Nicotiana sylvestris TaxID=4096 RepID=UPI00388C9959
MDVEAACPSVTRTAPPPEVIAETRPLEMAKAAAERETPGVAEFGSSSAGGRGKTVAVEDDGSGFDINPQEVRTFEERFTRVELFAFVDPSSSAYQTLILEIESARWEERMTTLYKKIESKYREYRTKHKALVCMLDKDALFPTLRDEIRLKNEELKEKDDEFMRVIGRCSELEETLRTKNDELEVSKGVMAECTDLQAQVASLLVELEQSKTRATSLRDELAAKASELERIERARSVAMAEATVLAGTLHVLRSKRASEAETFALKEARLKERIGGLEGEVLDLNEQITVLKVEKAQQQA